MTEKLIIKNFAGIQELEIEVKKINILIGPETSGKSICAKLLFYFKDFFNQMSIAVEDGQTREELEFDYTQKFMEYFPTDSWGNLNFVIRYEISDTFISIKGIKENTIDIILDYSNSCIDFIDRLKIFLEKNEEIIIGKNNIYENINRRYILREVYRNYLVEELSSSFGQQVMLSQLFVPAGRAFFSILQNNIFSFLYQSNKLDPFLKMFGSTYENIKESRQLWKPDVKDGELKIKIQEEIEQLIEKSLNAKYVHTKDKGFFNSIDGRKVDVVYSSSGQQELLPLTTILRALAFLFNLAHGCTVYIEEPEAHLFPRTQRNIVELISMIFNYGKNNLQFFVTTHSPYILTAVNNLLQAGQIYDTADEDTQKKLEEIIPRYKSLNTTDVAAYSLSDGRCQNIIDPKTGLIDAQIIDSVSEDLAIEFDSLLNLI